MNRNDVHTILMSGNSSPRAKAMAGALLAAIDALSFYGEQLIYIHDPAAGGSDAAKDDGAKARAALEVIETIDVYV